MRRRVSINILRTFSKRISLINFLAIWAGINPKSDLHYTWLSECVPMCSKCAQKILLAQTSLLSVFFIPKITSLSSSNILNVCWIPITFCRNKYCWRLFFGHKTMALKRTTLKLWHTWLDLFYSLVLINGTINISNANLLLEIPKSDWGH